MLHCQTAITELPATRSLEIVNMAYTSQLNTCAMPVSPSKALQAMAAAPALPTTASTETPLDAPKATSQMYSSSLGSRRVAGRWSHVDVVHSTTPTHPPEINQNHTVTFPLELVHRGSMTQRSLAGIVAMSSKAEKKTARLGGQSARPGLAGKMSMHAMDGHVKLQVLGAPGQ